MSNPETAVDELKARIEVLEKDAEREIGYIKELEDTLAKRRDGVRQIRERADQWRDILKQVEPQEVHIKGWGGVGERTLRAHQVDRTL